MNSHLTRRSVMKLAPVTTLPTIANNVAASNHSSGRTDYIEWIEVLDELCNFPHPDQGDILRGDNKFIYIELKDETEPDPQNTWIESEEKIYNPVTYPKNIWINDTYKHTTWKEKSNNTIQYRVDHGFLFEIPPSKTPTSIYIDGTKQKISKSTQNKIASRSKHFEVRNINIERKNSRTNVEAYVQNKNSEPDIFNICVNIKGDFYYTKFKSKIIDDNGVIQSEAFHGKSTELDDVEVEVITGSRKP